MTENAGLSKHNFLGLRGKSFCSRVTRHFVWLCRWRTFAGSAGPTGYASQNFVSDLLDFRLTAKLLKFFNVFLAQYVRTLGRFPLAFAAPFALGPAIRRIRLGRGSAGGALLLLFCFVFLRLFSILYSHHDLCGMWVVRLTLLPIPVP